MSRSSSGRGAKKASGTSNAPFASPVAGSASDGFPIVCRGDDAIAGPPNASHGLEMGPAPPEGEGGRGPSAGPGSEAAAPGPEDGPRPPPGRGGAQPLV